MEEIANRVRQESAIAWQRASTATKDFIATDSFRMARDRLMEMIFFAQLAIVAAAAVSLRHEAMDNMKDILGAPSMFVRAAASGLFAAMFGCSLTVSNPKQLLPIAYVLPWATPLIFGTTLASFESDWKSQLPLLGLATLVFAVLTMGILFYQRHFKLSTSLTATALKTYSLHLGQIEMSIGLSLLNYVWTLAWIMAAAGVYQRFHHQRAVHEMTNGSTCATSMPSALLPGLALALSLVWTHRSHRMFQKMGVASATGQWWKSNSASTFTKTTSSLSSPELPLSLGQLLLESLQVQRTREGQFLWQFCQEVIGLKPETTAKHDAHGNDMTMDESMLCLGFYNSVSQNPLTDHAADQLKHLLRNELLFLFLTMSNLGIAMVSASFCWLLDSSNALHSLLLGFVAGWMASSDSFSVVMRSMIQCNLLGASQEEIDGNLLQTNIYFTIRREVQSIYPRAFDTRPSPKSS